jgi:hypothetical protein
MAAAGKVQDLSSKLRPLLWLGLEGLGRNRCTSISMPRPVCSGGTIHQERSVSVRRFRNWQCLTDNLVKMDDASDPRPNDAKAKAAHYRARAFEVRKRAVEVNWTGLKASFLQIAGFYDKLARQLEAASAEELARTAQGTQSDAADKLNP